MIFVLLVMLIIILFISYKIFCKDIMQPAIIMNIMYIISVGCACVNVNKWNISLNIVTFFIILLGTIEFIIINYLFYKKIQKNNYKESSKKNTQIKFNIKKWKVTFICIFNIITILCFIYYVVSIAKHYGNFDSFSQALSIFKEHTSYNNDVSLPKYVNWLQKFTYPFAYIMLFYYLKDIVNSNKNEKVKKAISNIYYLISPICFIIQEFITSNRLSILSLLLGVIVMLAIIYYEKYNWNKLLPFKSIFIICVFGVLFVVGFYYSATLVGRKNSKKMIDYITLYAGGSIECLNLYIKEPPKNENYIVGQESFYYLIKNLNDYKLIHVNSFPTIHLEFRHNNDEMIGNVYTAYRRWINDFGYFGAFVLNGIMAAFYGLFYNILKKISNIKLKDFFVILYAYMAYPVFLHCIDGYFYLLTVRIAFFTTLAIFATVYLFVNDFSLKTLKKGILK